MGGIFGGSNPQPSFAQRLSDQQQQQGQAVRNLQQADAVLATQQNADQIAAREKAAKAGQLAQQQATANTTARALAEQAQLNRQQQGGFFGGKVTRATFLGGGSGSNQNGVYLS